MNSPIVEVNEGKLKGFVAKNIDGGEYLAFYGIPFAQPPIGALRFKEPRAPRPWSGIRDASICPPKATQYDFATNEISGEEDCLYLNVATSSLIGKKAVMVYAHGGAFAMGEANMDIWGPDYFIKHDVVLVTVAYRLGCLGFLNLGIPEAAGNQGAKDVLAGLKWVNANIHAFGGDPENLTLFGISAGASLSHLLAMSPLTKGLIHKTILQSATMFTLLAFNPNPVSDGLQLARAVGKITTDAKDALKFLMTAATSELIEGQKKLITESGQYPDGILMFGITLDPESAEPLLPEVPRVYFKKGLDIPLILGFTNDEGIAFTLGRFETLTHRANADFAKLLKDPLVLVDPKKIDIVANSVKKFFFGEGPISPSRKAEWIRFEGSLIIINSVQELADVQMNVLTPTYLYKYSYVGNCPIIRSSSETRIKGASHGDDGRALFHNSLIPGNKVLGKGTTDRLVMERMTQMWTNFAKTGNPTPKFDEELPCKWPPLNKREKIYLDINDVFTVGINPHKEVWEFWKSIFAQLYQRSDSE